MEARSLTATIGGLALVAGLIALLRRLVRLAGPGRPAEDADLRELRRAGAGGTSPHR